MKTSLKTWAVNESAIAQVVFARERSTHHRDGLHCKMTAGTPGQAREFDRALLRLMEFEPEKIERIEKEARTVDCPCCGNRLKFTVSVSIQGLRKLEEWIPGDQTVAATAPAKSKFTDDELAVLARFKASGAFDSFRKAVELSNCPTPSNLERAFLNLPNVLTEYKKASLVAIKMCLPVADRGLSGRLQLWKCGYADVITRDGEIVMFLPAGMSITGKTAEQIDFNGSQETVTADNWIRTRFGYVAGKGLTLSALRQKGTGAFALADRPS